MTGSGWARFERIARSGGERPAFIDDAGVTSFAELHRRALSWAARDELRGVGPGMRVLVWSPNSVAMAAGVLGAWARGAVPVLLGTQTPWRHVVHAAQLTGAACLAAAPGLAVGAAEALDLPVLDLHAPPNPRPFQPASASSRQPGSIIFTSGSTGPPKGAVQTHASLQAGADAVGRSLGITAADRILCGVPWSFDYGWGQLLFTLLSGVPQVLPAGLHPPALCEAITRHRPSVLAAVPALLAGLTGGPSGLNRVEASSVRLVTSTGGRAAPALVRDTALAFAQAEISLNYGLTETYRTTTLDPALACTRPGSVGRAIPGVWIAVLDGEGRPMAAGEVGEVIHRGVGVFDGYWGDPQATARIRRPDPLWRGDGPPGSCIFTGDLGYLDAEGLLYLVGRRDRQTKSMGVRVSPEEIEAILADSGLAQEIAVLSRPHETFGDMVTAVVVPHAGGSDPLPGLKRHARLEMSAFMQPREYQLADTLPRTASGKIDYPALGRRFAPHTGDLADDLAGELLGGGG